MSGTYLPKPVFAPSATWYKGATAKTAITKITLMDKYTPTGSETESWYGDVDNAGNIKCYVVGTELIIAGNGKGKLWANEDAYSMFGGNDYIVPFSACTTVSGLNLLDTSNAKSMEFMFGVSGNNEINSMAWTSLDLSAFNTHNVVTMQAMFQYCNALTSLNLSAFDMSNCTNVASMFVSCSALTTLNLAWSGFKPTTMFGMFVSCSNLATISGMGLWDTSDCTDMSGMFAACTALTNFSVSTFDTSNVTDMHQMFQQVAVTSLNLNHFNTAKVTNMQAMFYHASISSLSVSTWDVGNVTNMASMFNSMPVTSLNISTWRPSKVQDFSRMFRGCAQLTSLQLSDWNANSVTTTQEMFYGCTALTTIGTTSSWQTPNLTNMNRMFWRCENLNGVNLANFNTANVTDMDYWQYYAYRMSGVTLGPNFKFVGTNSYLMAPSSTYITGATGGWYSAGTTSPKYTPAQIAGLTRTIPVKYVAVPGAV